MYYEGEIGVIMLMRFACICTPNKLRQAKSKNLCTLCTNETGGIKVSRNIHQSNDTNSTR